MNLDEPSKLQTAFGKYAKNPSPSKQLPNFLDLGFGSSDPFNRPTKNRISNSPLKIPLENAITKVVAGMGKSPSTSRISLNYSNQTSMRNEEGQGHQQDDQTILDKLHPEALEFLQKHFNGTSTKSIDFQRFVDKLMEEFSNLWTDAQARTVLPEFVSRLAVRLGQDNVLLWRLEQQVRENGIIGLILNIFQQLKAEQEQGYSNTSRIESEYNSSRCPQSFEWGSVASSPPEVTNLKNILQEFTQGLIKTTQNQIYSKLNGQMRRLVMKYNEAESLLKQVNTKITMNIDKISYGAKKNELEKNYQNAISRLNQRTKTLENELEKERISKALISSQNTKLLNQNRRLNEVVDKFQNHIINTQQQPRSKIVMIPEATTYDDKSRIIGKILPHQTFSKIVPLSPLKQTPVTYISKGRGDKENNVMLNTATIVHRAVTPTKQRVVHSPSKIVKLK